MFGFIKNLFSGIAAFFGGLFGGKKSQDNASALKTKKSKGYFLELDDTGNLKAATEAKKPEAAKAQAPQTEPAKTAVATLERPKAEPEANGTKPVAAKEVPSGKETVQVQAQPNPPAAATNGKVEPQDAGTFAPNYLLPKATNSRRRPGPSMDMFRDMARQVKTK